MFSSIAGICKRILGIKETVRFLQHEVSLETPQGTLYFMASTPVEHYRIAGYGEEKEFLDFFLSMLSPDDLVFDIGASVGLFTIHASSLLGSGSLVAFEPDPDTQKALRNNVGRNPQLTNISYVSWAVSDTTGETLLYSDGVAGCAPSLRKQPGRENAPRGKVRVSTNTLDNAIASGELPLPTVLKIDIEGAEILCVKGALRLLRGELGTQPRLIFLEAHPDFLVGFNSSIDEVHRLILDKGYKVYWTKGRDNQIHYCYQSL